MDKIINVLLLIIIFVFDPLAISLVIAANFAFDQAYPKRKYKENLYGEFEEEDPWNDLDDELPEPNEDIKKAKDDFNWEAAERRMEIIGQNGNDGDHYSELDLNMDGVIDEAELKTAYERIQQLEAILMTNITDQRRSELNKIIKVIKLSLTNHNNTKTY
jgi:hypothetical protein